MNIVVPGITWSATDNPAVEAARGVRFGEADATPLLLDLYRPAGQRGRLPIVLYLHGGGWRVGTRTDRENVRTIPLAERGFIVASSDYRLSGAANFPAPLNDARQALHWLHEHAGNFGGDRDRIAVSGGSAGAHLAALLALSGPNDLAGSSDAERAACDVAEKVGAVISWFPVTDLIGWDTETRNASPPPAGSFAAGTAARSGWPPPERAAALLGVKHIEDAPVDVIRSADPRSYIAAAVERVEREENGHRVAPFLILHGDADSSVGFHHARLLHEALRLGGVRSTLLTLADADHEDAAFGAPAPLGAVTAFLRSSFGLTRVSAD
jgi:acetyl esterase/lipase